MSGSEIAFLGQEEYAVFCPFFHSVLFVNGLVSSKKYVIKFYLSFIHRELFW